ETPPNSERLPDREHVDEGQRCGDQGFNGGESWKVVHIGEQEDFRHLGGGNRLGSPGPSSESYHRFHQDPSDGESQGKPCSFPVDTESPDGDRATSQAEATIRMSDCRVTP